MGRTLFAPPIFLFLLRKRKTGRARSKKKKKLFGAVEIETQYVLSQHPNLHSSCITVRLAA